MRTARLASSSTASCFDYPERKADLETKGHCFRTSTPTPQLLPAHVGGVSAPGCWEKLRGQFAFALWDARARRLLLARDRWGICPLFWTVQHTPDGGVWLLFASEIKALFASGMVPTTPPTRAGLNHLFTFFATPGPVTCFEGVQLLRAGHFLEITPGSERGRDAEVADRAYWEMDFPDLGDEGARR